MPTTTPRQDEIASTGFRLKRGFSAREHGGIVSAGARRQAHELADVAAGEVGLAVEGAGGFLEELVALARGGAAGGDDGPSRQGWNGFVVREDGEHGKGHEGKLGPRHRMSSYFPLESDYPVGMAKAVDCRCKAFQRAIDVLGRPWTAAILTSLGTGRKRFCELGDAVPGIGDKVLAARLKDLEARGLVDRHVEPGPPVRVAYDLSPKGRAFGHVAEALERWGRAL
jgi:DNA-binding HxlR family transcriptional regulator